MENFIFDFRYVRHIILDIFYGKMDALFETSGDPNQTPRPAAASDLGLHCLSVTRLGVSSLQWVKGAVQKKCATT